MIRALDVLTSLAASTARVGLGMEVGAPDAVYKIIAWKTTGGNFTARAYIINQDDSGNDLNKYLTTILAIEDATGLDFFSEMDDEEEEALESRAFTKRWEDN